MSNAKLMMKTLEAEFAKFDSIVLAGTIEYMKKMTVRIAEAKVKHADIRKNAWAYYDAIYAAAGGKGNYALLQYGFSDRVLDTITKSEKLKCERRNIKIAKKLEDAGIIFIRNAEFVYANDGFNGVFAIDTDHGSRHVTINTIFAHGEIQCPHYRVLVKIK